MPRHLAPCPLALPLPLDMHSDTDSDLSHASSGSRAPPTWRSATFSSDDETVEYPRSGMRHLDDQVRYDSQRSPTPVHHARAHLGRKHGRDSRERERERDRDRSYGDRSAISPGSTIGHHASRITLGAGGLFENRPRDRRRADKENHDADDAADDDDEYDPERPVEKLVRGIDRMPRSNIFAPPPPPPPPHHLAHLAPRHHRPVQPSPLRSLVVPSPSPDPSVASRSKSKSNSRSVIDRSDERGRGPEREAEREAEARRERYQTRVEDVPDDEGTPPRHAAANPPPARALRVTSNPETRTTAPPPTAAAPRDLEWADMTRLTGMLATPRKGAAHGVVPDDGAQAQAGGESRPRSFILALSRLPLSLS